jgi:hypothetical protein
MPTYLLLSVSIGLNLLILFKLYAHARPTAPPSNEVIEAAVHEAYDYIGLPAEAYAPDFDLQSQGAGKVQAVLYHAGVTLGIDHHLKTVGDIIQHLMRESKG